MAEGIPLAFPVDLTRKWRALAERRKAHLVDLYDSGRWRLYYSEQEYILRLREAIGAVERWSATEQSAAREAVVLSISPAEVGDSAPLGDADEETLSGLEPADSASLGDADDETLSGARADDNASSGDFDGQMLSALEAELERESA